MGEKWSKTGEIYTEGPHYLLWGVPPLGSVGNAKRGAAKAVIGARVLQAPDPVVKAPERAEQRLELTVKHLQWQGREQELSKAEPCSLVEVMGD